MEAYQWHILGIDPTTDEAAIRRAYAAKLKITNPEDDIDGFKALRQAYEQALQHARWRSYREQDGEGNEFEYLDSEDTQQAAAVVEVSPVPPMDIVASKAPSTLPDDPALAAHAAREEHRHLFNALIAQLRQGASAYDAEVAFEKVIRHRAMDQLDVYAATENWVAEMLHRERPSSDALIAPAIAFFRWDATAGADLRAHAGAAVLALRARVTQEGRTKDFVDRLGDRRHEFHRAWRRLQKPPQHTGLQARLGAIPHIALMRRLLAHIDALFPFAQDFAAPEALEHWRDQVTYWSGPVKAVSSIFNVVIIVGFLIAALAFIASLDDAQKPIETPDGPRTLAHERIACVSPPLDTPPQADVAAIQASCERALNYRPESVLLRAFAGRAALMLNDPEKAAAHFLKVLEREPEDAMALYGLGLAGKTAPGDPPGYTQNDLKNEALQRDPAVAALFKGFPPPLPPAANDAAPDLPERLIPPKMVNFDVGPSSDEPERELPFDIAYTHFDLYNAPPGEVRLICIITVAGAAERCQVQSETPERQGLGELALYTVERSRWLPARKDGKPLEAPIRINVKLE